MSGKTNLKRYLDRCARSGEDPNPNYMEYFEKFDDFHARRFDTEEQRENNLEWDMMTTVWFTYKVQDSTQYAQNLYAALCNNEFQKIDLMPILKNETWGCSWRSAGGIVAEILGMGDYMDWYCSGIMSDPVDYEKTGYVAEGVVTDEILEDLNRLGWRVIPEE